MTEFVHLEPTASGGGCACGGHNDDPVLDVRPIPHSIRHATVFGAFDTIPPNGALILIAPHNPIPLLNQLAERAPIGVEYLLQEPEEWQLRITRLTEPTT